MRYMAIIAVLGLTGCAGLDTYKATAVNAIAQANDRAAADAELVLCRGISVGAWVRLYGQDAPKAEAWRTLCLRDSTETPAP